MSIGVIVGDGGAEPGIARQRPHTAGIVQRDDVGRVGDVGRSGVKVAVQVTPPSDEDTAVSVPFAIVRSALVNPLTASLKVKVTSVVSPACSAVSATTMVAVDRSVSIA